MAHDFPPLYRYSHADALRYGEEAVHMDSFAENVSCARAIEQAVREHFNEATEELTEKCAQSVLVRYGFKRTMFVLANSVQRAGLPHLLSDEVKEWGKSVFVVDNGKYNRYFTVDTAAVLLDAFVGQVRQAYQALELFGPEHCAKEDKEDLDYEGKVLVLSLDTLQESCWTPKNQLWYAHGGFGCSPNASGRAVYAVCLGDGEETRWDRADFTGVLDERFLPDWAAEKLDGLRQRNGPVMGSMS